MIDLSWRKPLLPSALLAATALHLSVCSSALAQINVERLFPPAVTAGEATTITAEGKFPSWPVKLWCDRDDVTCEAAEESGHLNVTAAAESAPGIAWLRFYDDAGASSLMPLLIEPIAITPEVEPNNEIAQATRADLPAVIIGRLEKANDVDCFVVSLSAGQTLVADVMANRVLGSPMDGVLQLVDSAGNVLAQSDDARGLDPQLVHECRHDADYVLRLFAFPEAPNSTIGFAGAASFVYRMQVTTGPLLDYGLPLVAPQSGEVTASPAGWHLPAEAAVSVREKTEISPPILSVSGALGWHAQVPSDTLPTAALHQASADGEPVVIETLPAIVSGRIAAPGQADRFRVSVESGKKYRAAVHSQASSLRLDSLLRVTDPQDGKELARNDDASRTARDSSVDFTAPAGGVAELRISDMVGGFGSGHAYSASIAKIEPSISLSLAADRYALPAGGSVEVPVTIQRKDGFAEQLTIVATELPEGVTSEPVLSEPKGDSSKEVKLKLSASDAAAHQGSIRIIALSGAPAAEGEATAEQAEAVATATFGLRSGFAAPHIWLSVSAKK